MYCTLGLIEGVYGLYINKFEPQNLAIPTKRDNFLFKSDLDVFWSAESIFEVHFCPKKFVQPARNLPCLPVHNCSEQLIGLWVNTGDWAHTTEESRWVLHLCFECSHLWNFRAHIARWCTEISYLHRNIKDHQFDILIKAGHPGTSLPSPMTVSHNIRATFECCCEHIDTTLKVSLWICIMDCLFNLCIGTLWACTFCNWCVDIPKLPGLHCLDSASTPQ